MSTNGVKSGARRDRGGSEPTYEEWATELRRDYSARKRLARRTDASGYSRWPTPAALDEKGGFNGHSKGGQDLVHTATRWQTPRTVRGGYTRDHGRTDAERLSLEGQAKRWSTPSVPNGGRTSNVTNYRPDGSKMQKDLQAVCRSFLPDQMPAMSGHVCSPLCRRLNPRFVEWLMAWPIGWTACEPVGTAYTLWLRRWRSWLFGGS